MLTSSLSTSNLSSSNANTGSGSSTMSNASSSSSMHMPQQQQQQQQHHHHPGLASSASIHMLSGSNIHINADPVVSLLDGEEIGVGIPTPECLPQSRKHSIVQSKLATPRLSSS